MIINKKYFSFLAVLTSVIAYLSLAYLVPRENFIVLFTLYSVAFLSFIFIYKYESFTVNQLFKIGLLFRILFFFGIPFWSQDFYRFIWDGNSIVNFINPYLNTPNQLINSISIPNSIVLITNMGTLSASHFSNYAPINQLFFTIASSLGNNSIFKSVFILKVIIVISDVGIYHFGKKFLLFLNKNPKQIFLYFLNPLVIIELTGNLHFEGVMLFFFILGLYYFFKEKWIIASVFIAISISIKLIPLLLLPFFYHKLGFKKSIYFYSLVIAIVIATFIPFISENLIKNYTETVGLWFTNFEFNASIYYLIREVGYYYNGYNSIGIIGKITPIVTISILLFFSLYKLNNQPKKLLINMLIALTLYFFISTTIHPWYGVNLLFLCLFTHFKFPILWSYLIVLSYYAYSQMPFKENIILLFIEYILVIGLFVYEVFYYKKLDEINTKKIEI